MDRETRDEFVKTRAELRAEIREVEERLIDRIGHVEERLRGEMREEGAATRRHFDVVAESLRDDIRIIAEGLIALDAKVEATHS